MKISENEWKEAKTTVAGAPIGRNSRRKERKAKEAKIKNENVPFE